MTIMVVGGTGFLGRRLVRRLAQTTDEHILCLDLVAPGDLFSDLGRRVSCDIADLSQFDQVIAAMTTHRPRAAINLSYLLGSHDPHEAMRVNVLGMDNYFEASRLAEVERVLYASAVAVYGKQSDHGDVWLTETDQVKPDRQYGYQKVFNEWTAREYGTRHGMSITGLRVSNIAAPGKLLGSVDHVECIVKPAMGQPAVVKYADQRRCALHIDDIVEVFATMATAEKNPQHPIYNSGGHSLSHADIADMVRQYLPSSDISFEHEHGGIAISGANQIDNSRLCQEYGISYPPYAQRVHEIITAVRACR